MSEKHWLDEMIEKYGNDQNNGRDPADIDKWEYRYGGDGRDTDGNGKREIDCSHFVNMILKEIGYDVPYQTTSQMKNSKYFEEVPLSELQKGDIVLFKGHVGFYYGKDETGRDLIYNSSGRRLGDRGPSLNPMDWWGTPIKVLRPKKEFYKGEPIDNPFENYRIPGYAEKVRQNLKEGTRRIDPLVIDLNGDGIKLTDIKESNAMFDLSGSGFANKVGWVSKDDAFLVWDKNNNGKIDYNNSIQRRV